MVQTRWWFHALQFLNVPGFIAKTRERDKIREQTDDNDTDDNWCSWRFCAAAFKEEPPISLR